MPFPHTDFDHAFRTGSCFIDDKRNHTYEMKLVDTTSLVVTSGRLIASDPALAGFDEYRVPFVRTVPPGNYPVQLAVTRVGQFVVCAARLVLSDRPAVRWEMALKPGQSIENLLSGERYGYGVDTGMGCFYDEDALTAETLEGYSERLMDLVDAMRSLSPGQDPLATEWTSEVFNHQTGNNIVLFSSGFGDGAYPSYWGIGDDGRPTCLVTDFQILVKGLSSELRFPLKDCLGMISHPVLTAHGTPWFEVLRPGDAEFERLVAAQHEHTNRWNNSTEDPYDYAQRMGYYLPPREKRYEPVGLIIRCQGGGGPGLFLNGKAMPGGSSRQTRPGGVEMWEHNFPFETTEPDQVEVVWGLAEGIESLPRVM